MTNTTNQNNPSQQKQGGMQDKNQQGQNWEKISEKLPQGNTPSRKDEQGTR